VNLVVSKHAIERFRQRIDQSVKDDAEAAQAIIDSIENGAVTSEPATGGATVLRTRRPYAMKVVVNRSGKVLTVAWASLRRDQYHGLRRSRAYGNHRVTSA